jgi:cold shock protein
MTDGSVKWFDTKKGYGFILGPEGRDVFVHYTSIDGDGFRSLREGDVVEYELVQTAKGFAAAHVRVPRTPATTPKPSKLVPAVPSA